MPRVKRSTPKSGKPKPFIHRFNNGKVWAKGFMLAGKPHGRWVWFYKTGVRMGSGSFIKGKKSGKWMRYDKKGKLTKTENFPHPI